MKNILDNIDDFDEEANEFLVAVWEVLFSLMS